MDCGGDGLFADVGLGVLEVLDNVGRVNCPATAKPALVWPQCEDVIDENGDNLAA